MSVRLIFRCQFCDARPDPLTQLNLEKAMRENRWGAYQNALPENWLVFHGRGLYGSARYACAEHRGGLVAYLREHFGTIGSHVWARPPYPSSLAHADTDRTWIAATRRQGNAWWHDRRSASARGRPSSQPIAAPVKAVRRRAGYSSARCQGSSRERTWLVTREATRAGPRPPRFGARSTTSAEHA